MLEQLTAQQLAEWEAYNVLDPIGEHRDDARMGILASTFANIAASALGGKKGKTFKPEDFIPKWDGKGKSTTQTVDQMRDVLMGMSSSKRVRKKPDKKKK